jgi:uncharacterized cupredoxin-like copper-binding protein
MTRVIKILAAAAGVTALGLLIASASLAGTQATKVHHAKKVHTSKVQHVTIVIKSDGEHGKKGSDGKWHDAFLPANFKVKKGARVVVTVKNFDDMPHTFTSPSLHVNKVIAKGSENKASTTRFSFKAKKAGKFLWWCALPCDPWAMSHVGFMRGYVKVHT